MKYFELRIEITPDYKKCIKVHNWNYYASEADA
jgi:hypothetical protein